LKKRGGGVLGGGGLSRGGGIDGVGQRESQDERGDGKLHGEMRDVDDVAKPELMVRGVDLEMIVELVVECKVDLSR
jgi:hypothetical protein